MASSAFSTTIGLQWFVRTIRLGGLSVPIARLRTQVYLPPLRKGAPPVLEWGWLDTGAPLSVIPFDVHRQGLIWRPLAGVRTTWSGQPCDVGHIDIWLSDLVSSSLRGPLSILAKFPQRDPPGDPIPILLGLEFVIAHQTDLALPPPPQPGILRIP